MAQIMYSDNGITVHVDTEKGKDDDSYVDSGSFVNPVKTITFAKKLVKKRYKQPEENPKFFVRIDGTISNELDLEFASQVLNDHIYRKGNKLSYAMIVRKDVHKNLIIKYDKP